MSPCEAVFAECGTVDDGCGHAIFCGSCPPDRPTCIDAHCYPPCNVAPNGTPCESSSDPCAVEACKDGFCDVVGVKPCPPTACYAATACQSATGACAPTGYVGDGTSCTGSDGFPGFCDAGACSTSIACWIDNRPWILGFPNPRNLCEACLPGVATTAWTAMVNGTPCPSGLCVAGSCEENVCLIGGVAYDAGDTDPANACRSCQPAVSRFTLWRDASPD